MTDSSDKEQKSKYSYCADCIHNTINFEYNQPTGIFKNHCFNDLNVTSSEYIFVTEGHKEMWFKIFLIFKLYSITKINVNKVARCKLLNVKTKGARSDYY